ncbi:hypothetical protein [Synechococcus sp. UW140]|uniref:hypothetical protein n=1 Tax=Synechococcus sp. UW140 TaxID=368503 RepID=UPI0031378ECB
MIRVFQDFYSPQTLIRKTELSYCWRQNSLSLAGETTNYVRCTANNSSGERDHNDQFLYYNAKRMSFSMWIQMAIQMSRNDDICILLNSDIYLDAAFISQLHAIDLKTLDFLALSRYEIWPNIELTDNPHLKQDLWAFRFVDSHSSYYNELSRRVDFNLGVPGCDNRMSGAAWELGFEILNPSKYLRSFHVHHDYSRNYTETDRVFGLYYFPNATGLGESPSGCPAIFKRTQNSNAPVQMPPISIFFL